VVEETSVERKSRRGGAKEREKGMHTLGNFGEKLEKSETVRVASKRRTACVIHLKKQKGKGKRDPHSRGS